MIDYNTKQQQVKVYDDISLVRGIAPNLWTVDDCFGQDTYQKLRDIHQNKSSIFLCSNLKKRLELSTSSPDHIWINQIGQTMAYSLTSIVGCSLNFMVAKYWLDLPTFGCQDHQDSSDIFVSYQIYLGSALTDEIRSNQHQDSNKDLIEYLDRSNFLMAKGAKFLHVDPPASVEFKSNHGYINLNSDLKLHRVDGSWDTRISVMFQYARV